LSAATIQVERAGYVVVQDLGRTGLGAIGISANGAGDQSSARLANTLVGNGDGAALIEIIASELMLKADSDLLIAVTGAAKAVEINSFLITLMKLWLFFLGLRFLSQHLKVGSALIWQ